MDAPVRLEGVTRRFDSGHGPVTALDDVWLDVGSGSFVAVMGATGSGKSTLMHCAAGLDRASAGRVRLAGREVGRLSQRALTRLRREHVGFVFQSYNLLSELTVAQNVLLPRRLGARNTRPLTDLLAAVGLDGLEHRPVGELSGGQQQRVAIARALSTGPDLIFADEPTGALDPGTGGHILGLLRAAVDTGAVTVVMVTHDPQAAAVSDRLIVLQSGRIVGDRSTPDAPTIAGLLRRARPETEPVPAR